MTELIEYYKGIFTILSSCASRQLEEVTFRRTTIPVQELFETAGKYFKKSVKNRMDKIELEIGSDRCKSNRRCKPVAFLIGEPD